MKILKHEKLKFTDSMAIVNNNKKLLSLINDNPIMNKKLLTFLQDLKELSGTYFTHISQIEPKSRFRIERDNSDELFEIYQDTLMENRMDFVSGLGGEFSTGYCSSKVRCRY